MAGHTGPGLTTALVLADFLPHRRGHLGCDCRSLLHFLSFPLTSFFFSIPAHNRRPLLLPEKSLKVDRGEGEEWKEEERTFRKSWLLL